MKTKTVTEDERWLAHATRERIASVRQERIWFWMWTFGMVVLLVSNAVTALDGRPDGLPWMITVGLICVVYGFNMATSRRRLRFAKIRRDHPLDRVDIMYLALINETERDYRRSNRKHRKSRYFKNYWESMRWHYYGGPK